MDLGFVEVIEVLLDCWATDQMIPSMGGVSASVEDAKPVVGHVYFW